MVAVVYPLMLLYSMTGQEGDPWEAVAMLAVGFAVYIGMILAAKVFTRLLRVPEQKRLEFECPHSFLRKEQYLRRRPCPGGGVFH